MNTRGRLLLLASSLCLLGAFAFPLWRVSLVAPQYPEGLGMRIHIASIEGFEPNDLDNINNLNHYIGMKRIEPSSIPELRIMPWLIGAFAVGGVAVALIGARGLAYAYLAGLVTAAIVGLVDFWRWEFDYGHNLDLEHAIIKVPGMSYQPPLIGSKQLLNFTASSWPSLGGYFLLAAVALAAAALIVSARRSNEGLASARRVPAAA